jgi:RHH-type rel operon transcriptional repressor/antitoxin RelB
MAVSIRLNPEIEEMLDILAAQTGRAKSYYLRELIEGGLEDLESPRISWRPVFLS